MRPINLIPPEMREGEHAPLRTGPLAYIVIGAIVAVLAGVTALVLENNKIADRETEIARLEVEDAREKAKAERLAAYTQFRDISEQRTITVASLADSRFDWERVMREISLILPGDVWLVGLSASATPGSGAEEAGGSSGLRAAASGPALHLSGCATGQEAVAGLVAALKDIEGVTRVGVESSALGEGDQASSSGSSEGGEECRTRDFIAKFEIVATFDAAPVPPSASAEAPATPAPAPAEAESTPTSESPEGG